MKKILLYIILLFTILIFINKDIVYSSFNYSINIFINNIFPSIFIFYILSNLLINYGFIELLNKLKLNKIFNLSNNGVFIFIMSILSGFPSSSIYCTQFLKNKYISINEANKLMIYSHFSNPLFIIMVVSKYMDISYAYIILFSHYISNIILAFIFRNIKVDKSEDININRTSIKDIIISYLNTLFLIFSIICIFILFTNILVKYIPLNNYNESILSLILEISGGINKICMINISNNIKTILIGMAISFGGLSIHLQIKSIISDTSISYHQFFASRLLHSILTGLIIYTSLKLISLK